jgi:hypothetical protein
VATEIKAGLENPIASHEAGRKERRDRVTV